LAFGEGQWLLGHEHEMEVGEKMSSNSILLHLKKHGQQLDWEIAKAMGLALPEVRSSLAALSSQGEISMCRVTRYNDGEALEGFQCRLRGYVPPAAPGRKPSN
jgi:predicted ArsR family transcriptional regulator